MSAPAVFELDRVTKRYGDKPVLKEVTLSIAPGTITTVLGPSGAGKSTLLRLLCLLEQPDSGALRFDGTPADMRSLAQRRRISMCFQRPALFNRSVRDNVALGPALHGHDRAASDALVMRTLARFGLENLAQARARTLSGGEAQRVALARALVLQTDVLLLDEPTANLDPFNVQLIERAIREIQRERALSVVWVTHNLQQALRLDGNTLLLIDGRLIETGPTARFFAAPQQPQSRDFLSGAFVW